MRKLDKDIKTFRYCEFMCTYERIKNDCNGNARHEVRITSITLSEEPKTTVFALTIQKNQINEFIGDYINKNWEDLK